MTTLSDGDWRRVEKAYRDNTETVDEIARRFGVAASTIRRRRKMENWPSRAGGRGQPGDGRVARLRLHSWRWLQRLDCRLSGPSRKRRRRRRDAVK